MPWLVGSFLAGVVVATIVVRVYDYLVDWASIGAEAGIVRPVLFVSSWTAVAAPAGAQRVTSWARRWQKRSAYVHEALTRGKEK